MEPIPLPDTLAELVRKHCSPESKALFKENCETLSIEVGVDIFKEGDPADQLYIVRKGKAKVYGTFATGSTRILRFARDGQVLGHRGIGGDFTYTVTATALVPTTVDLIPMPLFLSTLKADPAFSFHFMLFFAEELRRSEAQSKALMNRSVEQRVANALLATLQCFGFDKNDKHLLAFTPSRQDLADYAGSTYESTIRALSALQKKKLIKAVGKEIRVLDRKKLAMLVRG
ncbi:MAG: Crp/Fnr family transcriptional regulator [Flavobacteriales bacterium]|jgi:CRP/FNR family transcriptional regulator|nr:Crp/Fnr family transcriptional regulator [Flavobacteriales bacterium]